MEAKPDLKSMSTTKKLEYIWDYYRFHIIGILILVVTFGSIIHHYATVKDSVLDMVFINANSIEDIDQPFEEFLTMKGFDIDKQEVFVTTSLAFALDGDTYREDIYTNQTISAVFATGELDIFACPYQVHDNFASYGYVCDLRELFSEDELALYNEQLVYTTHVETGEVFPSAFDLEGNRWLTESGLYNGRYYISATASTDDPELTKEFLLYILNY